MEKVYLNKDKSIECEVSSNGTVFISSNHTNKRNSQRLVKNISNIISTQNNKGNLVISLNNTPYAIVNKSGGCEYKNLLTSFETKLFAQGKKTDALPFQRFEKKPAQLKTDLHTHFAGALSPELLIETGLGKNILFPKWVLDKAKIDTTYISAEDNGQYLLENVISNTQNRQLLVNSMKIDTSEQETFNKMEDIYAIRGPFTKNPDMFIPMIEAIAKDAKADNVNYLELSLASVISNTNQLKQLEEVMPNIEKETGVKIRFLGALWRHSDKEWNADEVDRLKVTAQSPYVVGCDVMGHETNSTMEFYDNIKELAKYAIKHDPNFVIRVHAGENPLFKANARQVLLAVEEAHYELSQDSKKVLPYPQVRLGHGIYGFDEPAPWDEKERTKDISMQQLCDEIKPIIEFNMSSNLSLNNINGLSEIPIKKYMDSGIRVVLGTDGKGIYSTDIEQEMILAHQAGLSIEDLQEIAKTEDLVIKKANQRFNKFKKNKVATIEEDLAKCFSLGGPQYTKEVEMRNNEYLQKLQKELPEKIRNCGAETDLQKVLKATENKIPIMITGSSAKHWPKISEENKLNIKIALDVLIHCIDTDKAYLMTGGTNHGVEREAHILANKFNSNENGNLVVLGTLTEEAMNTETNSIEPNTITHAMIPLLNGKPAKKWFDLPDTVLQMVEKQNGVVVAMGGGPIVSDIIQRSHNMGINLSIMSGVEGASGDKSTSLEGNDYSFSNAKELIQDLINNLGDAIKPDVTNEKIDELILQSYNNFASEQDEENINNKKDENNKMETKILKLYSLNTEEYPNIEIECLVIEDMKAYSQAYLDFLAKNGEYPKTAKKTSIVTARPGIVGEEIDTRPRVERDGKIYVIGETKGKVKVEGSMIVCNPDGEEYIVKPEAFAKKYQATQTPGEFLPVAEPIKYVTLPHDIAFKAPWGEDMFGVKGGVINISNLDDIYAIQNEAFSKTYTQPKEQEMEM